MLRHGSFGMLTVHHLGKSQSERIVWLCEELGIPYELKRYERLPVTMLAPPEYKALHPLGAAPVITDGDLVLAESGAIMEYILAKHGDGRLALGPDHPDFAQYLYWFHFANGNLQPNMGRNMVLRRLNLAPDNTVLLAMKGRLDRVLDLIEKRLGEADYFAGSEFTAADIIMVFSLTTMRVFLPIDLAPYPNMLRYLRRIGAREAYQRAMRKGDPGMKPLLT
jgi:glutathione S-transferase